MAAEAMTRSGKAEHRQAANWAQTTLWSVAEAPPVSLEGCILGVYTHTAANWAHTQESSEENGELYTRCSWPWGRWWPVSPFKQRLCRFDEQNSHGQEELGGGNHLDARPDQN